ncbi:MAG: hypothetical protein KDD42_02455 [Bdellovibrionales bacterium]|nr:hypothetical protein [Bdellovibrionales bacterium]
MKCITHQNVDSVGCCRWCGRGLCAECCVELPEGLACRDRCESDVKALGEYMRLAISKGGVLGSFRTGALMYLVFTVFFAGLGVLFGLAAIGAKDFDPISLIQAVIFLGLGCFFLLAWRRNRNAWK